MITLHDKMLVDDASIRRTQDGYLAAMARIARSGVQVYKGSEMGRSDLERVRVLRPEGEVFKTDALRSLAHRPLTMGHPRDGVNSDNWRDLAVGHTGEDVVRDGQFVKVPMLFLDARAIRKIDSGERELSVGYTCDIDWSAGRTDDGQEYDAVQKNIRANHVALVSVARGGPELRVGDETKECPECGKTMPASARKCPECGYTMRAGDAGDKRGEIPMRQLTIDGITVQVEDRDAQIIQKHIDRLEKGVADAATALATERKDRADAETKFKTDLATAQTQTATKDTKIAELEKQVADSQTTPAKLDELVKARGNVIEKARGILGDKLVVENKSDHEIRKQCVDSVVGDVAKDWNETQVIASFASIGPRKDTAGGTGDGVDQLRFPVATNVLDEREKAYSDRDKNLSEMWRGKQPAA